MFCLTISAYCTFTFILLWWLATPKNEWMEGTLWKGLHQKNIKNLTMFYTWILLLSYWDAFSEEHRRTYRTLSNLLLPSVQFSIQRLWRLQGMWTKGKITRILLRRWICWILQRWLFLWGWRHFVLTYSTWCDFSIVILSLYACWKGSDYMHFYFFYI